MEFAGEGRRAYQGWALSIKLVDAVVCLENALEDNRKRGIGLVPIVCDATESHWQMG